MPLGQFRAKYYNSDLFNVASCVAFLLVHVSRQGTVIWIYPFCDYVVYIYSYN
jgi:hypothetical protein